MLLSGKSVMAKDPPATLDLEAIRAVCVQHDGRYMPLDTLARDVVKSVTGREFPQNRDPVTWLLAWTFEPQAWQAEPLITIANSELRREIGLPAERQTFSYDELSRHARLRSLMGDLSRIEPGRKMDPLESKVSGIHDRMTQLQAVFRGQSVRIVPDSMDALGTWRPAGAAESVELVAAWEAARQAFLADDAATFAVASQQLVRVASSLPAAFRPAPACLSTELRYNRLAPFRTAAYIMLVGTVVAALAMIARRRWFDTLAFAALMAGLGMLTYGLALRWQIAGRIPASNMFESLLFLGWGVGAFAIFSVPLFRQRLVPFTASAMSSLALVLADVLPIDSFVRPIAPVLLDTIWMSIHVPIIMASYSVLLLAVLVAHIQLVAMAAAPRRAELVNSIDTLQYWYMQVGSVLLSAGIITGSVWAASSWGRYWGWDPKEVWSLVALLGYLTILHVRIDHERAPRWLYGLAGMLVLAMLVVIVPKLAPLTAGRVFALFGAIVGTGFMVLGRGPFATAAKNIICFWLIVMTYVGVNFVLGIGLHSYGFGAGAVARYMFVIGGADLAIVVACAVIYLARSWRIPALAQPSMALATA
jgi:ABC-type transport system involved in cytochrome c biogenesis permease subunit